MESGLGIARVGPTHPSGATGYDADSFFFFQASAVPKPSAAAATRVRLKCLPGMEAAHAANLGWVACVAILQLIFCWIRCCSCAQTQYSIYWISILSVVTYFCYSILVLDTCTILGRYSHVVIGYNFDWNLVMIFMLYCIVLYKCSFNRVATSASWFSAAPCMCTINATRIKGAATKGNNFTLQRKHKANITSYNYWCTKQMKRETK